MILSGMDPMTKNSYHRLTVVVVLHNQKQKGTLYK